MCKDNEFPLILSYLCIYKSITMRLITPIITACLTILLSSAQERVNTLFDDDWEFTLLTAPGKESRKVDLPHDWSICNDFIADASTGNDGGYLPAGKGRYRKTFEISHDDFNSRHFSICIEGAYMNATLKVNGYETGTRPYGYSSAIYDITPYVRPGDNTLEITVDNSAQKNCRWYSGSGIYRHVWLTATSPVHIAPWSLYVTTPHAGYASSTVSYSFEVNNPTWRGHEVTATASVIDHAGAIIATSHTSPQIIAPDSTAQFSGSMTLASPRLWSPDDPNLYTLKVEICENGSLTDNISQTFGIREITFSPEGMTLNGRSMILNGGCVHHDNGLLGARSYDAAEARKVRLLKQAGFNAVRTSHNPPSPAFLDECDRQGLLVIDEAFDGWRESKTPHDYSQHFDQWWERDIEAMVLRDRNHPSVICWSTGNEIIERKKPESVETARRLASLCRTLDPSRPVTSALAAWDSDWEIYDPLAACHDITGYNYMIHKAESDHERVPDRVMWQTESYPRDAFSNWLAVTGHPYIVGDFVWTAIDYLGESGIGRHYYTGQTEGEHYERDQWPWHGAACGDIDLTGHRKPISHYREMLYNPYKKLYMAVREPQGYYGEIQQTRWGVYPLWESWNWPRHRGKPIEVEVASRYPSVRLYLNGNLVGEQNVSRETEFKTIFTLPYQPGILRAEGIDENGNVAEQRTLATAGVPAGVRLIASKPSMAADNRDLIYITAELVDANGTTVPDADLPLHFEVSGPATVEATCSADLTDTSGYCNPTRTTSRGRALAVIKSTTEAGDIILKVTTPLLHPSRIRLESVPVSGL